MNCGLRRIKRLVGPRHTHEPAIPPLAPPFLETKELVAGYTLIQAKSREEAIEWARRWPAVDGNGEVELELRQIYESDDFGEEFSPAIRKQEDLLHPFVGKPDGART